MLLMIFWGLLRFKGGVLSIFSKPHKTQKPHPMVQRSTFRVSLVQIEYCICAFQKQVVRLSKKEWNNRCGLDV